MIRVTRVSQLPDGTEQETVYFLSAVSSVWEENGSVYIGTGFTVKETVAEVLERIAFEEELRISPLIRQLNDTVENMMSRIEEVERRVKTS